jgi:hypothetical protein
MNYIQIEGGSDKGQERELAGTCDVCKATELKEVYDAVLPCINPFASKVGWCWCCKECFQQGRGELGITMGQRYKNVCLVSGKT